MAKQFAYFYGSGLPAALDTTDLDGVIWGYVAGNTYSDPGTLKFNWDPSNQSDSGYLEAWLDPTIAAAHAAGLTCKVQVYAPWVWYSLGGNNIFTNTTTRTTFLDSLDDIVTAHPDLDGFELDWECDERLFNKTAHTAFYAAFKARFPTLSMGSTQTWRWSTMTSDAAQYLEYVAPMCYDMDGGRAWYGTMAEVQTSVGYWLTEGFPASKILVGVHFHAYPVGSTWGPSYAWLVDNYDPSPDLNAIGGYTYNGLTLVQEKAQWVKDSALAGIFTYSLTSDKLGDPRSLTAAIADILHDTEDPPGTAIDVGAAATVRTDGLAGENYTYVSKENVVNATGTIDSIQIYVDAGGVDLTDLTVGTYYIVSGTTLKVRDSEYIGAVTKGSTQTKAVSISAQAGDMIGMYYTTAGSWVRYDASGGAGVYYYDGECKDVGDEAVFFSQADWVFSLYGSGGGAAGSPKARSFGVIIA